LSARPLLALVALTLVAATPARADCEHFKWSVADERTWFASAAPLPAETGEAKLGAGYAVNLSKDVKLPVAPERAPAAGSYAAVLNVPKLDAGLYQVTVSAEAWIDVAQNGALVKSSAFSGQHDCDGVRKSVRFPLAAGPATLEISNAHADHIMVAISPSK
jgi:hypothetical protein